MKDSQPLGTYHFRAVSWSFCMVDLVEALCITVLGWYLQSAMVCTRREYTRTIMLILDRAFPYVHCPSALWHIYFYGFAPMILSTTDIVLSLI